MAIWQLIADERLITYSPIGLLVRDDFTGMPPNGWVRALLDVQDANLAWHETAVDGVRTAGDVITYPGLGRSAHVGAQPAFRYRVRIEADFYRADYLTDLDGVEFDAHPYDDQTPPAVVPAVPQMVFLLPAATYPYPLHVRVLRGLVEDTNGDPVTNVEVTEGPRERVLTDERGVFALPLRWPGLTANVQIDALDHRTGRNGLINVTLPGDLSTGHTITIA